MELEVLRFQIRLAMDLGHLDLRRYEYAARSMYEIGRLIGGWVRMDRQANMSSDSANDEGEEIATPP